MLPEMGGGQLKARSGGDEGQAEDANLAGVLVADVVADVEEEVAEGDAGQEHAEDRGQVQIRDVDEGPAQSVDGSEEEEIVEHPPAGQHLLADEEVEGGVGHGRGGEDRHEPEDVAPGWASGAWRYGLGYEEVAQVWAAECCSLAASGVFLVWVFWAVLFGREFSGGKDGG